MLVFDHFGLRVGLAAVGDFAGAPLASPTFTAIDCPSPEARRTATSEELKRRMVFVMKDDLMPLSIGRLRGLLSGTK